MDQESIFIRAEAALKLPLAPATVVMVQTFARASFGELTSLEASVRRAQKSTLDVDNVRTRVADLMRRCRELIAQPVAVSPLVAAAEEELRATSPAAAAQAPSPASAAQAPAPASAAPAPVLAAQAAKRPAEREKEDHDGGEEEDLDGGDEVGAPGAGAGAGAAPRTHVRKDARRSEEELASARFSRFPSWVVSKGTLPRVRGTEPVSYLEHYIMTGEVYCADCLDPRPIKVGKWTGNLRQHEEKKDHVLAVKAKGVGAPGGGNPFQRVAVKARTPEEQEERNESEERTRALTHALGIGTGTNPTQFCKQHGASGLISQSGAALRGTAHAIGSSERVVARDAVVAEDLMDREIAALGKGEFFAIGTDGSSMRREKAIIILLHDTIRREIKFTYNRSVLERMLARELAHMLTL